MTDLTDLDLRRLMAAQHAELVDEVIKKLPQMSRDELRTAATHFLFNASQKAAVSGVLDWFEKNEILYLIVRDAQGELVESYKYRNEPKNSFAFISEFRGWLISAGTTLYTTDLKDPVSANAFIVAGRQKQTTSRKEQGPQHVGL